MTTPQVAIIGAGIAGLACAHALRQHGIESIIYEKSRGPGGRISSKRTDNSSVDLGAQYFTARDPGFAALALQAEQAGALARWEPNLAMIDDAGIQASPDTQTRWVGAPRMGAFAHYLARDLRIEPATRIGEHRSLTELRAQFTSVVIATPADQARALLPDLKVPAQAPCWAVWIDIDRDQPFDAAFVKTGPLRWIANDASKPGRATRRRWVLHATPSWSDTNLELSAEQVLLKLTEAAGGLLPNAFSVEDGHAHRWRYARPWDDQTAMADACIDAGDHLWVAGDYCMGGRVEGAWLSGVAAAQRIMR
ncbi:NAD(P)/FAD-dependent oxidoreductase [Litorivicinus lipolyticus]|uniref:NAD(P)/FAD-dependent oxidoreductase n=1 Tax=Litorivicinus lipolyticus TaxID=418701 RepID=UPI003B5CD0EE